VSRPFPSIAALLTLIAGLATRALLSGFVAKYLGVALWATLVYFLVLFVKPKLAPIKAAIVTVVISFAVELFQITPVPMWMYQNLHPLSALVFGTTFNLGDLPAYVVGAAIGYAAHSLELRRTRA
jgi:hypothetical protein